MDSIKIEMKSNNAKSWKDTTLENFYEALKITRSILSESMSNQLDDFSDHKALWNIRTSRTIYTPVLMFRLAEGIRCPKCDSKFIENYGALSRRDNKTKICSNCGILEAYEDMAKGGNL